MSELRAFLDGVLVGTFEMSATGNTTFTYDDEYRSDAAATPLSLSMRTSRSVWRAASAGPWLAGLLPDSPDRLRELAAEYHVAENAFRLLERIGRDAAGAVQLKRRIATAASPPRSRMHSPRRHEVWPNRSPASWRTQWPPTRLDEAGEPARTRSPSERVRGSRLSVVSVEVRTGAAPGRGSG